jgi:hypothetical protein
LWKYSRRRTIILKVGRKHRALYPSPMHAKDTVKIAEEYDKEIESVSKSTSTDVHCK